MLRPYQIEAKNAVMSQWYNEGRKKTLLVQATGTGKTVVFSEIARECAESGGRVLILAHRGELLEQAKDKLERMYGLECAIEKAEQTSIGSDARIVLGSVQTMMRQPRLDRFPKDYFTHIIIDEAHHAYSSSYLTILQHFASAYVLGVTATPDRGDKHDLGKIFDSIAYEYPMKQAIDDGYLCPILALTIPIDIDLKSVSITQGDYSLEELGNTLDPYLESIADAMLDYCKERKTVVFLPLIATSQKFCRMLRARGFRAAEVNGKSTDRAEILKDFEEGKYDVLCNSMLLTEGWDCPAVDCIVVLRPTQIRSLYQQMVGRGTRLCEGKERLILLDFLWHTERHSLCKPASLMTSSEEISKIMDELIAKNDDGLDLTEAEKLAKEEFLERKRKAQEQRENKLATTIQQNKDRKKATIDPIRAGIIAGSADLTDYEPIFRWESDQVTEKQLKVLRDNGINTDQVDSRGMAAQLIDLIIERSKKGLSTIKQINSLDRKGFRNVDTWTIAQANRVISDLSKNNWKTPEKYWPPSQYKPEQEGSWGDVIPW